MFRDLKKVEKHCIRQLKMVYFSLNIQKFEVVVKTVRGVIWVKKRCARFFQYYKKLNTRNFWNNIAVANSCGFISALKSHSNSI